jgi:hypothetical protein
LPVGSNTNVFYKVSGRNSVALPTFTVSYVSLLHAEIFHGNTYGTRLKSWN